MKRQILLKVLVFIIFLTLVVNILFLTNPGLRDIKFLEIKSAVVEIINDAKENIQKNFVVDKKSSDGKEDRANYSNLTNTPLVNFDAKNNEGCLNKFNLSRNTIIFYHLDELHSNNMKPIVRELEKNYSFYWNNNLSNNEFNNCFGYSSGSIPTFICAGTKQQIVGEISKSVLESFAIACQ
ncbi:MAG: hypothetical protein QW041_02120 [Candidatus Pacearchaeota archaeon]